MHEFSKYSDEEQEEFLARVQWIPHEWKVGDWVWWEEKQCSGILCAYFSHTSTIRFTEERFNWSWCYDADKYPDIYNSTFTREDARTEQMKQMLWLPTADQLLPLLTTGGFYYAEKPEWKHTVEHGMRGIIAEGTQPLLTMLRGIQNCRSYCDKDCFDVDEFDEEISRRCNGIHPSFSMEPLMSIDTGGILELTMVEYHDGHLCEEHYHA